MQQDTIKCSFDQLPLLFSSLIMNMKSQSCKWLWI